MTHQDSASIKLLRTFVSKHLYWPLRLFAEKALFEIVAVALKTGWVKARIADRVDNQSRWQSHKSGTIDSPFVLWLTKTMCYSGGDVRAAWPIVGRPITNVERYVPWARWAHQHLTMYDFFFDQVGPQSQVLDLGGGIGNMAANLADVRSDIHVTVIDLDPLSIRIGSELFKEIPNLTFVCEDARSSKYVSKFDYCFMIELLEHVPPESHISLIETALSALKPDGKLFLTTPNAIEQEDEPWGHIGLLNLRRAKALERVFKSRITKFGYLSSELLTTEDPSAYSAVDDIKNIAVPRPEYSHYFFELKNN
jgi:2-polyprenyl-3-methyl-5-hydroxy-6-metoxy-1,4-benzoquinol methylase